MGDLSDVIIRRGSAAVATPLPDIERSAARAFQALTGLGWTPGNFVTSVEDHLASMVRGTLWVAEENKSVIGFLTADICGSELHIDEFNVRLERQRLGIGRRLIDAAVAHARAIGFKAVTLTTFRDVAWNGPFYRGVGFDILMEDELGARLKAILEKEARHGLPREKRCAMRMKLRVR